MKEESQEELREFVSQHEKHRQQAIRLGYAIGYLEASINASASNHHLRAVINIMREIAGFQNEVETGRSVCKHGTLTNRHCDLCEKE